MLNSTALSSVRPLTPSQLPAPGQLGFYVGRREKPNIHKPDILFRVLLKSPIALGTINIRLTLDLHAAFPSVCLDSGFQ